MARKSAAGRIAEVATEILINEGAAAVTMRRVAAAAGVTTMATYKHFPNRQALLRHVADASSQQMVGKWGHRAPGGTFGERVDALLDDLLDFALGSPHLYGFLLSDRREGARRFPQDFRTDPSPTFGPVVALVEEGIAAGELRDDDPLEVTLALTSFSQGLIQQYLSGRMGMSETDFRALCHRTTGRIINGLTP